MRPFVRSVVIFYVCMMSFSSFCVSQTEAQTISRSENTTLPAATDATNSRSESTFGPDAETHQNASAAEENEERKVISDQLPLGVEEASRKDPVYEFRFKTHVELNVKHITRNEKCCDTELRELSDSNMNLSLTLGFPNKCVGCKEYHVTLANCEIPKTKYEKTLGVHSRTDWSCRTAGVPRKLFLAHSALRSTLKIACEASKSDGDHNLCVLSKTCVTIAVMGGTDMPKEFLKYYNNAIAAGILVFAAALVASAIAVVIYLRRGLHPKPYSTKSTSGSRHRQRADAK